MLTKPQLVLIDLDGTLVDSVPDLAFCVDEMLKQLGISSRGETAVRQWVGNGVQRLIERAISNDLNGTISTEQYAQALPIFEKLYAENTCNKSCLYDGVLEGLNWLKQQGWHLGCITNKPAQFTLPLLETLGIRSFFEIVISGDTLPEKKPHPMPLLHAAEFFKVKPEQSLMVGDSKNDVQAARAAGFQVVCVPYGYNHGENIELAQPDAVIQTLAELSKVFE